MLNKTLRQIFLWEKNYILYRFVQGKSIKIKLDVNILRSKLKRKNLILGLKVTTNPVAVPPVQAQSVWCKEQILRDVPASDIHQDVTCHHLHERGPPSHTTGAGEASPLHRAGTAHWFVDRERQGGRRRHRLWANMKEWKSAGESYHINNTFLKWRWLDRRQQLNWLVAGLLLQLQTFNTMLLTEK